MKSRIQVTIFYNSFYLSAYTCNKRICGYRLDLICIFTNPYKSIHKPTFSPGTCTWEKIELTVLYKILHEKASGRVTFSLKSHKCQKKYLILNNFNWTEWLSYSGLIKTSYLYRPTDKRDWKHYFPIKYFFFFRACTIYWENLETGGVPGAPYPWASHGRTLLVEGNIAWKA